MDGAGRVRSIFRAARPLSTRNGYASMHPTCTPHARHIHAKLRTSTVDRPQYGKGGAMSRRLPLTLAYLVGPPHAVVLFMFEVSSK